jgi:hypothetical protein
MRNAILIGTLCLAANVCVFVAGDSRGSAREKKEQGDLRKAAVVEIIIANTKIMKGSESVFQRLKNNSDTMMRHSHYLNGHEPTVKREPLCPECGEGTPEHVSKHFVTEFEDQPEEVPETFEQLLKDCRELETSIKIIDSSLYSQSLVLKRNLKKLSDGTFITLKKAN